MALTLAPLAGWAAPPPPPAWQSELDAARIAETTAALLGRQQSAAPSAADLRLDELYRRLSAKYPDQAAVRRAAGDHFWRTGDAATAASEWQAAQALDPSDAETASSLGSAWLRDGQTNAARAQYQHAVDARPGVARYHFDLANVLYLFRHEFVGSPALPDEAAVFRAALGHYRRASELAADNVDFARAYAETFYGLPDPDWTAGLAAWDHVRTLTAAAPDFANVHLARVSLRMKKPVQAEGYLDLIQDPSFTPMKAMLYRQAEKMKAPAPGAAVTTP